MKIKNFDLPDIWESVTLAINRDCNIRCNFCPVSINKITLSMKKIYTIIKFYSSLNKKWNIRIKIQGGEPFLRWPVLLFIIKKCYFPNIQFVITTNGLLFTRSRLEILSKYKGRIELVLSIDDQKWDLENETQLFRNVSLLKKYKLLKSCAFNITLTPNSQLRIIKIIKRLKSEGAYDFRFFPAFFIPWKKNNMVQLSSTFERIIDITKDIILKHVKYPNEKKRLKIFCSRLSQFTKIPLVCDNLFIDNNGDILASAAFLLKFFEPWRYEFILGNVYKKGWEDRLSYFQRNPLLLKNMLNKLDKIYNYAVDKETKKINLRLLNYFKIFTNKRAELLFSNYTKKYNYD